MTPGRVTIISEWAGDVRRIFVDGRPLDYYAKLPGRYDAVSQADIARAALQYLHPDQLIVFAAGDRARIEPALKDLNIGPVEVRDVNGSLVKDTN